MVPLVLMMLVGCANAIETTICDCTTNELKGILKTDKFNCDEINDGKTDMENVNYTVYTTKEQQQTFFAYTCSTWTTTRSVWTSFFGGTDTIIYKKMNNVTREDCWKLINYKSCDYKPMIQKGNKWTSETQPQGGGSWLQSIDYHTLSCVVQEVEFQRDCQKCNLQTPFGEIPYELQTTGVGFFDQITYVWKPEQNVKEICSITFVQKGYGILYFSKDMRITDKDNQLDYMVDNQTIILCDKKEYLKILGIENIYITWIHDYRSDVKIDEGKKGDNYSLNVQAHTQFNNNVNLLNDNVLVNELRIMQCKIKQLLKNEIILTSQINPVLAAERMGFKDCHQIIGRGTLVRLVQCEMRKLNFTAEKTHCGWQPIADGKTISTDGWNLAEFHPCYWTEEMVNFNGKAYRFDGKDWIKITPNIDISVGRLVQTFNFTIDNSAKWLYQTHPSRSKDYLNQMAVLADVMAEMNGNTEAQETLNIDRGRSKISEYYDKATNWTSKLVSLALISLALGSVTVLLVRYRRQVWKLIQNCCDLPLRPNRPSNPSIPTTFVPPTVMYVNHPPNASNQTQDHSQNLPNYSNPTATMTPENSSTTDDRHHWPPMITLSSNA